MKIPEILMVETVHQPGSLVKVLQVIADAGLTIEHLTALRRDQGRTLWEITLEMDEEADRSLYERIGQLPTARFVGKSDRVFNRHRGGKIRTVASLPINTLQVLRDVYTPGVARVCLAIRKDPQAALGFTALGRTSPSAAPRSSRGPPSSTPHAARMSTSATAPSGRSASAPPAVASCACCALMACSACSAPTAIRRPSRGSSPRAGRA